MKNTRTVTHGDSKASAKGTPDISLIGGLVQLGYNISISKSISITPYKEAMLSLYHGSLIKKIRVTSIFSEW